MYQRVAKISFWSLLVGLLVVTQGCSSRSGSSGDGSKTAKKGEALDEKASLQYQFAYEAYITGDLIPALAAAVKTVELSPKNADARNLLGLIYFRQQKYNEAEKELREATRLDPKLSEAYNNLGTMYYEQKRYREAVDALESALENPFYLYPERIHNNLGLAQAALGQFEQAKSSFERAITLRNDFYLPYQNLGRLWLSKKEYARARSLLSEAVRLCKDCSEPNYHLGMVALSQDKESEARNYFKKAVQVDPQGYFGQLAKEKVSQMEGSKSR